MLLSCVRSMLFLLVCANDCVCIFFSLVRSAFCWYVLFFCSMFWGGWEQRESKKKKLNQQKIIIECTPAGIIWCVYISGNHKTYIITKIICTSCAFMLYTLFLSLSAPSLHLSISFSFRSMFHLCSLRSLSNRESNFMMDRLRSSGLWSISMHPATHMYVIIYGVLDFVECSAIVAIERRTHNTLRSYCDALSLVNATQTQMPRYF